MTVAESGCRCGEIDRDRGAVVDLSMNVEGALRFLDQALHNG